MLTAQDFHTVRRSARRTLQRMRKEMDAFRGNYAAVVKARREDSKSCVLWQKRAVQAEARALRLADEVEQCKAALEEAAADAEAAREGQETLQKEVSRAETTRRRLERDLKEVTQDLKVPQSSSTSYQRVMTRLTNEAHEAKMMVGGVTRRAETLEKEKQQLIRRLKLKSAQVEAMTRELEELRELRDQRDMAKEASVNPLITELKRKVREAELQSKRRLQEMVKLRDALAERGNDVATVEVKLLSLSRKKREMQADLEARIAVLEAKLQRRQGGKGQDEPAYNEYAPRATNKTGSTLQAERHAHPHVSGISVASAARGGEETSWSTPRSDVPAGVVAPAGLGTPGGAVMSDSGGKGAHQQARVRVVSLNSSIPAPTVMPGAVHTPPLARSSRASRTASGGQKGAERPAQDVQPKADVPRPEPTADDAAAPAGTIEARRASAESAATRRASDAVSGVGSEAERRRLPSDPSEAPPSIGVGVGFDVDPESVPAQLPGMVPRRQATSGGKGTPRVDSTAVYPAKAESVSDPPAQPATPPAPPEETPSPVDDGVVFDATVDHDVFDRVGSAETADIIHSDVEGDGSAVGPGDAHSEGRSTGAVDRRVVAERPTPAESTVDVSAARSRRKPQASPGLELQAARDKPVAEWDPTSPGSKSRTGPVGDASHLESGAPAMVDLPPQRARRVRGTSKRRKKSSKRRNAGARLHLPESRDADASDSDDASTVTSSDGSTASGELSDSVDSEGDSDSSASAEVAEVASEDDAGDPGAAEAADVVVNNLQTPWAPSNIRIHTPSDASDGTFMKTPTEPPTPMRWAKGMDI